ncbi:MAG: NAD(P)H-dependent oxidoreductase [Muribaculaceae bacterium]|nr:NAD(P)H-dependent oxidoreductase [Muribaculaceae bacterium]
MKSIKLFLLIAASVSSFGACAQDTPESKSDTKVATDDKILIVYFSRPGYNYNASMPNNVEWTDIGHTARVAGYIQEYTGGDTFEILPVVPYPDDYEETKTISTNERDNDLRPEFIGGVENIDDYDIVFIGGPVWYGGMPMIMHTFYDRYKDSLNGKTIVPYDTHAGSGIADYVTMARRYCPDSEVLEALAVTGTNSKNASNDVKNWLLRIGIITESDNDNASISSLKTPLEGISAYYTVSGIPVKNPGKGIYIKVEDGQRTKILK